ncbi:hypothetical protein WA588_006452 [Blastocystis sp. NMH]
MVWRGYYRNGRRYSEVVKSGQLEGYYDEKSAENGRLLSIAQYDKDLHDKNGRCLEYENGSLRSECEYENGVKKHTSRQFVNERMTVFDSNGKKVYEGKWFGDMKNGFLCHEAMKEMSGYFKEVDSNSQLMSVSEYDELNAVKNGKCFEMEDGKVKRVCVYENGVMKRVEQEFNGSMMTEYNENGKKRYVGEYSGNKKNGKGYCFDEKERMVQYCVFEMNVMKRVIMELKGSVMVEYDENRKKRYEGGFTGNMKYGFKKNGRGYMLDEKEVVMEYCTFDNGEVKRVIQEFNGSIMIEYNNGKRVYEGGFKGNMKSGFVRDRKGYELDENERVKQVCAYNEGTIQRVIEEFNGEMMIEYDENGKRVYVGGYAGDTKNGFVRNGRGYCVSEEIAKQYCEFEKGVMKRVIQEFDGSTMTEYNENGVMSYLGEWKGDTKSGFMREGLGKEYDKDGETALYSGDWKNGKRDGFGTEFHEGHALYTGEWKDGMRNGKGKEMNGSGRIVFVGEWKNGKGKGMEMDRDGIVVYEGEWWNGKRNGEGKEMDENGRVVRSGKWVDGELFLIMPSSLTSNPLGIEELKIGDNGYNNESVTELKLSGLVRLKRIVIGDACFGKVRVFELDGLGELESVVIEEKSFRISDSERSDGSCRIMNCPKLKSIQISDLSFADYHMFLLTNLPQLQSIKLGKYAFQFVQSVVFENFPQLQSIQLGYGALHGDHRDDRKTISDDPYNYKNTLTMKNLPSLTEFKGVEDNFSYMGSVILENIPQLSYDGIRFGDGSFLYTYSIQSSNAAALENYINYGNQSPSPTSLVVKNRTQLNSIPLDVKDLWISRFDASEVSEFSPSRFQSLKTLVIGNGLFGSLTKLELNIPSLQSVYIGSSCFLRASSFSLTDLPQLQFIKLGRSAFQFVQSVVFENLPKLQSIQLGYGTLHGDHRDDRKTISDDPYNYKNTLTMKNLPSLTEFKGDHWNFMNMGSVILENIPQLSYDGIQLGYACFRYTYSLQSSNAIALESYIRSKSSYL